MQSARLLPFDPIVLVQDVLKRWLVVVLAALAVGIGTYIYTDATYAPVYRTTTTFVVTTRGSSTSVYSNLSSTSNLAGLFTELLNSSIMRKTILQETDISSFDGTIDTAVVPNTNLITMTVTDADPRMAFLAAQAIIEHHESLTYQVIDDIGLEVLQYPAVPTSPTNQNFAFHQMKKAAVIAALAATALLPFCPICGTRCGAVRKPGRSWTAAIWARSPTSGSTKPFLPCCGGRKPAF